MAQEKIIIKFEPEGHPKLIAAIKRLSVETKKLTGSTTAVTAATKGSTVATKGSTVATKQAATATGVLDTRNKRLAKTNGMVANAFATLRSKLLLVAFAYTLVGRHIADMAKKFSIQEDAEKGLEAAIGRVSQGLLDFASAQQKVTTFGDENIIQAMSTIGAYTQEEDQIKNLTKASLDLAVAKGMDLVSAADMLSKSVFSTINALQRYGVVVRGMIGSTDRLDSATTSIANLFGGRARAETETLSGAFDQLSNSLGDFSEKMVESSPVTQGTYILTRAFTDLIDKLNESSSFFDTIHISISRTAVSFSPLAKIIFETALALGFLDEKVELSNASSEREKMKLLEVAEAQNKLTLSASQLMEKKMGMSAIDMKLSELKSRELQLIELEEQGLISLITLNTQLNNIEVQRLTLLEKKELTLMKTKAKATSAAMRGGAALIALNKKNMKEVALLQMSAAMIDAYAAAQSQYALVSKIAPPPFPQLAYAAAIVQGLAQAGQVGKAGGVFEQGGLIGGRRHSQGGTMIEAEAGEFVMSRSAVESVGIENMNRINEGGGGGAVTVNVSGNVMTEEFTEEQVLPALKEALRRGGNLDHGHVGDMDVVWK